MPDHNPRPTHDPPWFFDRARAHVLSLRDSILAVIGGVLIAIDALIPDGRWLASYSLAEIPHWNQVLIALLLVCGGMVTAHGVLVRYYGKYRIPPLRTIVTEKIGWMLLFFGWGTTAVAIFGNGRLGSTLSLCIMTALTLGALCKCALLWRLEHQVRGELVAQQQTTDALNALRGGD